MSRTMQVHGSVVVRACPDTIWRQVADPTQMSRWSPENTGATTPAVGTPLQVGERFAGTNRRGRARWVTECVVTDSVPGRRFAFDVRKIGARTPRVAGRIASWTYEFEPVEGGTRVTETWTDARPWPDAVAAVLDRILTGGRSFADYQRGNIARTLDRLKTDIEQQPA